MPSEISGSRLTLTRIGNVLLPFAMMVAIVPLSRLLGDSMAWTVGAGVAGALGSVWLGMWQFVSTFRTRQAAAATTYAALMIPAVLVWTGYLIVIVVGDAP